MNAEFFQSERVALGLESAKREPLDIREVVILLVVALTISNAFAFDMGTKSAEPQPVASEPAQPASMPATPEWFA